MLYFIELCMKEHSFAVLKGDNSCKTSNFKISRKCANGLFLSNIYIYDL